MAVLLAMGLGGGLSAGSAVAIGVTVVQPGLTVAVAVAHTLLDRVRNRRLDEETAILAAIAGELRAGRSLRQALGGPGSASSDHPMRPVARLAALGVPLSDLGGHICEALPKSAGLVVPAIGMLESSGGNAAAVFELLAESHAVQESLRAERRAALAPARLSALMLLVLSSSAIAWLLGSGRVAALWHDGLGRMLAVAGLVLIGTGVAVFTIMLRGGEAP